MKNTFVKNEHLLSLPPESLKTLRARAELHRRYSNIEFKVIESTPDKLVLSVRQGKSNAENYFDAKRLVEIGKETFVDLGQWKTIHAGPTPFQPAPPEIVTAEWIQDRMKERGLKVKDVSRALGVDSHTISAYKGGLKPLSGVVRAMFYYYLSQAK